MRRGPNLRDGSGGGGGGGEELLISFLFRLFYSIIYSNSFDDGH